MKQKLASPDDTLTPVEHVIVARARREIKEGKFVLFTDLPSEPKAPQNSPD